jgi:hypothetical protein
MAKQQKPQIVNNAESQAMSGLSDMTNSIDNPSFH